MQDLMYSPIMDEFGNYDRTMREGDIVRHFKGNLYQIVNVVNSMIENKDEIISNLERILDKICNKKGLSATNSKR